MINTLASATSAAIMVLGPTPALGYAGSYAGTAPFQPMISGFAPKAAEGAAKTNLIWLDRQLGILSKLPENWDGYGAEKVSVLRLNQIGAILSKALPVGAPAGSIVPGADGSIQAEWHTHRSSFGFVVDDDGAVAAWLRPAGEDEMEARGIGAVELLRFALLSSMI